MDGFAAATRGRPTLRSGDPLVFYASIWGVVFATGEVVDEAKKEEWLQTGWLDGGPERWPWSFELDYLTVAPTAESVGIRRSSLARKSYIRLTDEQLDAASRAILAAPDVRFRATG